MSTLKVWHHKFSCEFFHLLPRRIDSVSLTINQWGKVVFLALNMHYYCSKSNIIKSNTPTIHNIKNYHLSYDTLVGDKAILGAVLWQFPIRDIFVGFYNFRSLMSAQKFMSAQNSPKISLHGYRHSTAPTMENSSPRWHMKDNGHSYLFPKRCFLVLYIVGVLDWIRFYFDQ